MHSSAFSSVAWDSDPTAEMATQQHLALSKGHTRVKQSFRSSAPDFGIVIQQAAASHLALLYMVIEFVSNASPERDLNRGALQQTHISAAALC